MTKKHWTMIVPGAVLLCASPAFGVELRDAVQSALNTNPEIRQAVANRLATQEERVQGQGLWYPRVSVEGSAGVRSLRNPTRRSIGLANETLYPIEGDLIVTQLLYDSGGREAEIRRQASRTDAAAARVEERSEFVALNVSRTYIDYLLQQRLVAIAQDNVTFHERLVGDLREGVSKGSISIADQRSSVWVFGPVPDGLAAQIVATGAKLETTPADPLALLVRAQRIAVAIAEAKGLDPDTPRALTRAVILDEA